MTMEPMRRIRTSTLTTDDNGRLSYEGARFSGLAYRVEDDGVVRELLAVSEGSVSGTSDDWLPQLEGARLDRASLELADAYGPLLWRGAPVDGIVYTFNGQGLCLVEEAYASGQPADTARREWYPSGAPKADMRNGDGWAWFEDGRVRARATPEQTLLNLPVRDDGSLSGIVLHDPSLLDVTSVKPMAFSNEFLLTGRGVDDRLLQTLRDETGLGTVLRLHLIDTAVTPASVEVLASLKSLNELWLRRNRALGPGQVEALRARRPDGVVHYEEDPTT